MNIFRALTIALALCATLLPPRAFAAQNELVPPTAGIYTGVQFSQLIGDAFRSLASCNKGATAPANVGGTAVDGLCWIDDSATPWTIKIYVNGGWATVGALDPTDSSYAGVVGGGIGSINSASTTNLGSVPQASVNVLGTTTITGFGSAAPTGVVKFLTFASALTLTYSSALPVPCGFNLVTAANDRAVVTHLGSGNWAFISYQRASGIPVDCASVGKIEYGIVESVPANHVAGYGQALTRTSYPAYVAKVTRAQNGTRTSGNATIASVDNTSGLGAGMPVEGAGIDAGCTIASVTSNSITLNSAACVTSSGTSTVTVFLTGYGTSGSSSTVGVPDCRGRAIAGRDVDTPGSFAGRLTSSYFGADSKIFNVAGGAESQTLTSAQMPTHQHDVFLKDPGHTHTVTNQPFYTNNVAGNLAGGVGAGVANIGISTNTTGMTIGSVNGTANDNKTASAGSGAAHAITQPTLIAECIVRVTP